MNEDEKMFKVVEQPEVKEIDPEQLPEPLKGQPGIIALREHPKFTEKHGKESPAMEAMEEGALIAKMWAAAHMLKDRQQWSWDRIRKFSGSLFNETEEGESRFQKLRVPQAKLDSQRSTINQLRGCIQRAIDSHAIEKPDDIVPWYATEGDEENAYTTELTFLKSRDAEHAIKKYLPPVEQLESFKDTQSMHTFPNSVDKRRATIIDFLQMIRQIRHDHAVFLQMFQKEKNPGFLSAFQERDKKTGEKKVKFSKDKRVRIKAREKAKDEGAQMRWILDSDGAKITLERTRTGWMVASIDDPKGILTNDQTRSLGVCFSHLKKAPSWIQDIAREKGLI